jgi:hypothetical protein
MNITPQIFAGCILISGCSTTKPSSSNSIDHVAAAWNNAGNDLDHLSSPGTPQQNWIDAHPESQELIDSEIKLRDILVRYDCSQDEMDHFTKLWRQAHKTIHYAYEMQFQAIVFFDKDLHTISTFKMSG